MSGIGESDAHRLELQIAALQGAMETGFERVRGDINLLARGDTVNAADIQGLDARVSELESRRIPLPVVGGVSACAGAVIAALTMLKGGG